MRFYLLFALLVSWLHADPTDYNDEPEVIEKVLYLSYEKVPERLFKGEIFPLTVKTLSTMEGFEEITYHFSNAQGVNLITEKPERSVVGKYFYDTFYFQATTQWIRTPDITASLAFSQFSSNHSTTLPGKKIDGVALNPDSDFSQVLAGQFSVTNYKTTRYDRLSNIAVFSVKAQRANLEQFALKGYEKQGFESLQASYGDSTMTYYVIIPKKLENLTFSYFNLNSSSFDRVLIPIIVENDEVSTQSDLKPKEHKHELIKMGVAGAVSLISLVLLYLRRKIAYVILVVIPLIYIALAAVPIRHACVKAESPIYLLPMENGTIFEMSATQYTLEVQGEIEGYTKVKLLNNKIGWVKNEDLCTP